jgi:hypothetical protein
VNVVSLNCKSCGTRLERQELAEGECVFCQSRKLESEISEHERAAEQELVVLEQEVLWQV